MGADTMAKNLSLRDFFPVQSGMVREAVANYGDDFEEGAPMELNTYRSLAKALESGSLRLTTVAKAEVADGGPANPANIDELIEGLLTLERDTQALFSPLLSQAERSGAAWSEVLIRALEALRDCRWQMMALRADADRDESSPTFSDAGALKRFLDGLH
jgi:hypothetical protein